MSKLIKFLANLALWLIKAIAWLFNFILNSLGYLFSPFRSLLRFFYHSFILRLYRFYLFVVKKLGWSNSRRFQPIASILVNKNLIHILVVLLAAVIVWQNINSVKGASAAEDFVAKTPLARLVSDDSSDDDIFIEEYQVDTLSSSGQSMAYNNREVALNPQTGISTNEVVDLEDEDSGLIQEGYVLTEDDITPTVDNVAKRTESIEYTVKNGDTAGSIANKFGVSVNTILWANNLSAKALIQPGDKLTILPMTGVMHQVKRNENLATIANFYEVDQSKISEVNGLSGSAMLKVGQSLLVPGGRKVVVATIKKPSTKPASTKPLYINGKDPSTQIVAGGKMAWPTVGHTVTQYYSWRHNGLDIANKTGTPIYAAADGIVETASWNAGGYGYQVVINHGAGKQTRYAHMSAFAVKAGDSVSKGQNIGVMGSTGQSTGPHVHFEVMINGKRTNPLSYVVY